MIGKLNYHLGKRASDEGRSSARYKEVDFCKDPSAICRGYYEDDESNAEVRWLMGMLYWISKIQAYNEEGWSYLERLKQFTDGGMNDRVFLDDVSRIVTRGCHDQSRCGNAVSSADRHAKFNKIIYYFGKASVGASSEEGEEGESSLPTRRPATYLPSKRPTFIPTTKPTNRPSQWASAHPTVRPTMRAAKGETATSFPISLSPVDTPSHKVVTSSPVSVSSPEEDYKLTPGELAHRLNYANNYCASSLTEANAKCSTSLRTCNHWEPPCKVGTACWENIICSIIWANIDFGSDNEEANAPGDEPSKGISSEFNFSSNAASEEKGASEIEVAKESTSEIVAAKESSPVSDSSLSAVPCSGICLRPLNANECMTKASMIASLPSCVGVAVGEMCENMGECEGGVPTNIGNCPGGKDMFMRVLAEQCGGSSMMEAPYSYESSSSLSPWIHASTSPAPSLSAEHGLNGTPNINSEHHADGSGGGYDEFFELPPKQEEAVSRPGAWWIWVDSNNSIRLRAMPHPSLLLLIMIHC